MKTNTPERWEDGILITADQRETATLRDALAYAVENVPGSPLGRNALPLRDVLDKLLSVGTEQADPAPSEPTDSAKLAVARSFVLELYITAVEQREAAGQQLHSELLFLLDTGGSGVEDAFGNADKDSMSDPAYDEYCEHLREEVEAIQIARAEERADSLEGFDPHDV